MTLTSLAFGWRIDRADGVSIGMTSYDKDIWLSGLLYRSAPGLSPASILHSDGLENDGLELNGAISTDLLTQVDLEHGKWDRARITVMQFNWSNLIEPPQILAYGILDNVSVSDGRFEAGISGLKSLLDRPVFPMTSPGCRARFCGDDCGLNHRRYRQLVRLLSISGNVVTVQSAVSLAENVYAFGELRWLSGKNCGQKLPILSNSVGQIELVFTPFFDVVPGDLAEIFAGCGHTIAICADRFGNAHNFRGEPHVPGNDLLLRYPGG